MTLSKYVNAVGLEVEAGFNRDLYADTTLAGAAQQFDLGPLWGDGSIHATNTAQERALEIPTPPLDSWKEVRRTLTHLYAFVDSVNPSMGLHIHMSLTKPEYYHALFSWKFYVAFRDALTASALPNKDALMRRMNSMMCHDYQDQDTFERIVPQQIAATGKCGARYRAVNYCYGLHTTIEFRIFPAVETAEDAETYAKFVVGFCHDYLKAHAKDAATFTAKVAPPRMRQRRTRPCAKSISS